MHKIQVRPKYLRSWFYFWAMSTGLVIGVTFVIGFFITFVLSLFSVSLATTQSIVNVIAMFIAIPISYFTYRWAVGQYLVAPMLEEINDPTRYQNAFAEKAQLTIDSAPGSAGAHGVLDA